MLFVLHLMVDVLSDSRLLSPPACVNSVPEVLLFYLHGYDPRSASPRATGGLHDAPKLGTFEVAGRPTSCRMPQTVAHRRKPTDRHVDFVSLCAQRLSVYGWPAAASAEHFPDLVEREPRGTAGTYEDQTIQHARLEDAAQAPSSH
jgi:hypothetical protein